MRGKVKGKKRLGAVAAALMIIANPGLIENCEAQNKTDKNASGQAADVLIQKEKGPGGHSTIGIVERPLESDTGETVPLTFSKLMVWQYEAVDDTPPPEKIAKLNGRKVKLTGFMYPLQQGESIQYFCLLRTTQTCCYGPRPQYNQYVFVEMDAPTEFYRLDPVSCVGKLRVEPTPDEGYIYRIEGEICKSATAKDSK